MRIDFDTHIGARWSHAGARRTRPQAPRTRTRPAARRRSIRRHAALGAAVGVITLAVVSGGCGGSGEQGAEPAGDAPDYEAMLAGSPPRLAALHAEADELLPGGLEAFERRLGELAGFPVVVNKWASWCGPCRAEFPLFQSQGAKRGRRVAFLGVDANDSEQAAATFLRDHPVPYPSFFDPDEEIDAAMDDPIALPATAFYDREGSLTYLKQGQYSSEQELAADIRRYAR